MSLTLMMDSACFAEQVRSEPYEFFYHTAKELLRDPENKLWLYESATEKTLFKPEMFSLLPMDSLVTYSPLNQVELFPSRPFKERPLWQRPLNRMWWISMKQLERRFGFQRQSIFAALAQVVHYTQDFHFETGRPALGTLNELSPLALSPLTLDIQKQVLKEYARFLNRSADAVIVFSKSARDDAARLAGLDPARLQVIHPGVHEDYRPDGETDQIAGLWRRLGLKESRYFIFHSHAGPACNEALVLEVFLELRRERGFGDLSLLRLDTPLSTSRFLDSKLGDLAKKQGIYALPLMGRESLRQLYSQARGLLIPSLYSDFGLEALEALACGCPVLASRRGGLEEALGLQAEFVDPEDAADLQRGIAMLAERPRDEQRVLEGVAWARSFDPRESAQRVLDLYRTIVRRPGPKPPLSHDLHRELPVRAPQKTKSSTQCPKCQGDSQVEITCRHPGFSGIFLYRCLSCALVFTWPQSSGQDLDEFYNLIYQIGDQSVAELALLGAHRDILGCGFDRSRELGFLTPHLSSGRLLDVGCSWGFLASQARDLGFEAHGTEISRPYADFGRRRLGLDIRVGTIEECRWPDAYFNALILCHSLEHFRRPWESIPEFSRIMQPGGFLVIIVPNFDSFLRKKLGENWRWITPKAHYFHFTRPCLERILLPYFELVEWRSEEGHYGLETILEYVNREEAESLFAKMEGSELIVVARKPPSSERHS